MRVCHITTVHPPYDMRIFHKECVSLAKAGHEVTLLVSNGPTEVRDGVNLVGVPVTWNNRRQRMTRAPKALFEKALALNADVYHFHDPEFLRYGKKLAKLGRKVVYDVHEDVPKQIMAKYWIPAIARKVLSLAFKRHEERAIGGFSAIMTAVEPISDRLRKFNPNTLEIKNYPIVNSVEPLPPFNSRAMTVVYVGSITKVRGIMEMVEAADLAGYDMQLGGFFSPESLQKEVAAQPAWKRVNFLGMLDLAEARECMQQARVGLVTLHKTPNYMEALPVKLFEYMLAGLPVVISDVPLWKSIVEKYDCGIAVDPTDTQAIATAITQLMENPQRSQRMGENGRKAVISDLNWNAEEAKLLATYASFSAAEKTQ